jgi:hypothetical protein
MPSASTYRTGMEVHRPDGIGSQNGDPKWLTLSASSRRRRGGKALLATFVMITTASTTVGDHMLHQAVARGSATTLEPVGTAFPRPVLTDPIQVTARVSADRLRLSADRDYIIVLPAVKKKGVLEIIGGRNIWVIGGYLSVSASGPNIIIADGPGSIDGRVVHLEGVLINASSGAPSDGIRIKAPTAIIQIVNSRIVGLLGSSSGFHADVIQPFDGVKALRIDGFTASSHYNNLYLRRENDPLGPEIGEVSIYNTNIFGYWNGSQSAPAETLRAISIGTQPIPPSDVTSPTNCELTAPVVLREVYIQPARKRAGQFVYPHDRMQASGCPAVASPDGLTLGWPGLGTYVDGVATVGPPPNGDFVRAADVGLNYVG